jgi:hypothetical protein
LGGKAIRCHLPLPELARRAAQAPAMAAADAQGDASHPSTAV